MNNKIFLNNTLSKSKKIEEFVPRREGKINFFVCGPTVFDYSHLGHAKAYIQFDFIVKYLRYLGYEVTYIQNITDLDDKIIIRAQENGVSWDKLSREYEKKYLEDMASLGVTAVTKYARATDYIDQMVKQVKVLLEKGFAYRISDGIYYEVSKFADYGKLSGRTELKENDAVSRVDENKEKRGWNDFCLWKISKEGEPFWETELGKGRPGWHIEDTAITESFFGPQYDIHGGGLDLIFPHHEAEIAQMEAVSGKKPLVQFWLHVGFLNIDSEKMSKSKGNFKTIRQVLEMYDFKVLRYLFLSLHYRSPINFSESVLEQAKNSWQRMSEFVNNIDPSTDSPEEKKSVDGLREKVVAALSKDFDTPTAFAAIFEFMRAQNFKGVSGKYVYDFFVEINQFLGIFDFKVVIIPEEIKKLAEDRVKAKTEKKWTESDRLRDLIKDKGYVIEDGGNNGYKLKKI